MRERTLFLIPARGGSRRIRGKNLRPVAGIPLVGWAIRIARAAAEPEDPVVCSTEDPAIAAAAQGWGATVLPRPAALATADASSTDVASHALTALSDAGEAVDVVVLVQPTSPLTDPADLAQAVQLVRQTGRSVVSVMPSHPAAWHHDRLGEVGTLVALPSIGDAGRHLLSGAFYATSATSLRTTNAFVEPGVTIALEVDPERSIDIDEEDDLIVAAARLRARPVAPFRLGDRAIGPGAVFVIAEAGVNHDGDVELAHRLVDAAADAGADAVKFQTFAPAALAGASAPTAAYQRERGGGEDQLGMLERLALPEASWPALKEHAQQRGIVFLSTPFDDASAVLLDRLEVPGFKVGSGELTDLPFLARLARFGRPMIVSTGMGTMVEVGAAVDAIRGQGLAQLALLHCVSVYPAAPEDANLAAIATLREAFGLQAGWSDHTPGTELPIAAAALGATIVEKHLTLDRARSGPDHAMSLEPTEMAAMIAAVRVTQAAIGDGAKVPTAAELEIAEVARRSLHWTVDLPAGAEVAADHLVARRPGTGIPPAHASALIGRRTRRAVLAGALVAADDA